MRYAQRGGYPPAEQQRREGLRLEAAGRFARGDRVSEIAHDLRVTPGSVRRWHRAWQDGGAEALRSSGPVSRERLSPQQWARLELELRKGPLAHGCAAGQRWTLGRIKTLIGRLFHVGYTVEGTWKLMRRHGWSCQVPARQAMERDDEAVAGGEAAGGPHLKAPRPALAPSSASRARRATGCTPPHETPSTRARRPAALVLPAAGIPPRQGRAQGVQLERLPGPDHRHPPSAGRAAGVVLG